MLLLKTRKGCFLRPEGISLGESIKRRNFKKEMNAFKVSVDVEQLKAFNSQLKSKRGKELKSINMKGVDVSVDVSGKSS